MGKPAKNNNFLMFLPVVLAVVICVVSVNGEVVTLSQAAALCAEAGCQFDDPAIWSSGVVPTSESVVRVENTFENTPSLTLIITNAEHHVSTFLAFSVNIQIVTTLKVFEYVALHDSSLSVSGTLETGSFFAFNSTAIEVDGLLNVTHVDGELMLENGTSMVLKPNAVHEVYSSVATYMGSLSVPSGVAFRSYAKQTKLWSTVIFESAPTIRSLHVGPSAEYHFQAGLHVTSITLEAFSEVFVNTSIVVEETILFMYDTSELTVETVHTRMVGNMSEASTIGGRGVDEAATSIIGNGTLYVINSNLTISNNGDEALEHRLALVGVNHVGLFTGPTSTLSDKNMYFMSDGIVQPYTTFYVQDLTVTGPITLYGQIVLTETKLTLVDHVTITGGIISTASGIEVNNGELQCPGASLLFLSENGAAAYLHLNNSTLRVDELVLTNHTVLSATGHSFVTGDVINSGRVVSTQRDLLRIFGDYTQTEFGDFYCQDLDDVASNHDTPSAVVVDGTAHLNGTISYKMNNPSSDKMYTVFNATNNYTGAFHGNTNVEGSSYAGNVDVRYSHNIVAIHFTHAGQDKKSNVGKWVGISIGIAAGVILLAALAYYLIKKKRRGYVKITA